MTSLSENTVVTTSGGMVELGYQSTDRTNLAITTTQTTDLVSTTVVCDGSPITIDFQCGILVYANEGMTFTVWVDGVNTQSFVEAPYGGNTNYRTGYNQRIRLIPSAGVHTISVRWNRWTGTTLSSYLTGACILRVSKVLQASQFIVPLASAPLVTSLPSAPIDGQEIRYVVDATNNIIWNFRYRAAAASPFQWEFIGGPPLSAFAGGGALSVAAASPNTTSPSFTVPLAGKYIASYSSLIIPGGAGQYAVILPQYNGVTPPKWDNTNYAADEIETGSGQPNYYIGCAMTGTPIRLNTAGGTLALKHRVDLGTGFFLRRQLSIIPSAVG